MHKDNASQLNKLRTEYTAMLTTYQEKVKKERTKHLLDTPSKTHVKEEGEPQSCWPCFRGKKEDKKPSTEYELLSTEELYGKIIETGCKLYDASKSKPLMQS